MGKADEIARISGFNSISAFLETFRHIAGDSGCDDMGIFLVAANVIDCLATEVDSLSAEVERLTDKIDDLKEVTDWNVALSDAEVAALARGVNPASIRPDAIIDPGRIT
jgi:outer membrane murein-binding lipoprotein Lpp